MQILNEYLDGERLRASDWNWPKWRPVKGWFKELVRAVNTYVRPNMGCTKRRSLHQRAIGLATSNLDKVVYKGKNYIVTPGLRWKQSVETHESCWPYRRCDVVEENRKVVLMAHVPLERVTAKGAAGGGDTLEGLLKERYSSK